MQRSELLTRVSTPLINIKRRRFLLPEVLAAWTTFFPRYRYAGTSADAQCCIPSLLPVDILDHRHALVVERRLREERTSVPYGGQSNFGSLPETGPTLRSI